MGNTSTYESRTGKLKCTDTELFNFIGDISNMGQLLPEGTLLNWDATADSCHFDVPHLGAVRIRITERVPYSLVSYSGDAFGVNPFDIVVSIGKNANNKAEVRISLTADLNPLLKAMASGHIEKFLDIMVSEMEKIEKWTTI